MALFLKAIAVFLWLLVAAAVLLLIAVQFPPAIEHSQIAGALLGAVGTIFAGWLAWTAVERQLKARETERTNELANKIVSLATDVLAISYQILGRDATTDALVATARSRIETLDAISIPLGGHLRSALREADDINRTQDQLTKGEAGRKNLKVMRPAAAFRLRLMASAIGKASDDYRNGRKVSGSQMLSLEEAKQAADQCGAKWDDDLTYLRNFVLGFGREKPPL